MSATQPLPEPIWQTMLDLARDRQLWLVGGAIRDHLLQRATFDADFAVVGDPRRLARRVAGSFGGDYYDLDRERGAGRVLLDRGTPNAWILDFASLRGDTIEQDLRARDFTVNALALDLTHPDRLIDHTGGLADLKAGVLRACSETAIVDDPVRALRAVRLASNLRFHIEVGTLQQVRQAAAAIPSISAERVRDELFRILGGRDPTVALRTLDQLGLLSSLMPELAALRGVEQCPPHAFDAFEHSLAVLGHLTRLSSVLGPTHDPEGASTMTLAEVDLKLGRFRSVVTEHLSASPTQGRQTRQLLYLAALFHDVGKSQTGRVEDDGRIRFRGHEALSGQMMLARAGQLKLSTREAGKLVTIVRYHHLPADLDRSRETDRKAIYRYFEQTGEAGIDIGLLSLADRLGMYVPPIPQDIWRRRVEIVRVLFEAYFEGGWLNPPRLLPGDELADILGVEPGPELGRLLGAVREAQATGDVKTRDQAIALARDAHERSSRGTDSQDQMRPDDV
jgi:poly(A) polymerase